MTAPPCRIPPGSTAGEPSRPRGLMPLPPVVKCAPAAASGLLIIDWAAYGTGSIRADVFVWWGWLSLAVPMLLAVVAVADAAAAAITRRRS